VAHLRLFASAREAAGTAQDVIDGSTVEEVLNIAVKRFGPQFESVLGSCRVWLNGESVEMHHRVRRARLQAQEDAVSFVRRLAQGRLDLARDEERRRQSNDRSVNVESELAEVFGQEHGGGSARPPRETNIATDHPLVVELERLCESLGFGSLRQLDVDSLRAAIEQLAAFELARSSERRALFDEIDALTAELVRRYKDGGANVDSLLAE
jgi:molybdopterin converting factor small subunit